MNRVFGKQSGFAKIIVMIVVIILLAAGVIVFFVLTKPPENSEVIELTIEHVLVRDERAGGIVPTDVIVSKQVRQFLRGTVTDARDGIVKTFFAIQIGDIWRIVDVVTEPVSCERFARLGFPSDIISDCKLTFSDAVTVAEIDETIDSDLLSEVSLSVIGFVDAINEQNQTITLQSGGESITLHNQSSTTGFLQGDLIVVSLSELSSTLVNESSTQTVDTSIGSSDTMSGNNDSSSQSTPLIISAITIVRKEDDGLYTSPPTPTPLPQEIKKDEQQTSTTNDDGFTGGVIHKINAPHTSVPPSYFLNVYDLDNSFVDVQLEGSF